ncbi:hypothetical protein GGU11DRAFT_380545 [Lentinula aff. detonsa]|nr:hypothetical protein GGU11DRAFT_380545 [Lentinula aff. detonsa]
MRISTTFLIFGLASVVAAAPHPTFPAAQAMVTRDIDHNLSMLGRDVPLYHARRKGPKPPVDNTESESKENQKVVISCTPKGSQGVALTEDERTKVVSLIKAKIKHILPDLEPDFPHQPQRFDQSMKEIAPGSKPDQIVTFTYHDQKTCKGSCTGRLNFRTRECKIIDAKGKLVTQNAKSSTKKPNSRLVLVLTLKFT